MEVKCKVHEVGSTQEVTDTFKKRDLIVEYAENPQYPEFIKLEAVQDKISLLDELRPGDEVTVHFNLRGRPWTDKTGKTTYFNTLSIWRINIDKTVGNAPAMPPPPIDISSAPGEGDDLPL